jgi:TonB family protein
MPNQVLIPPPTDAGLNRTQEPELNFSLASGELEEPVWRSLARQVHDRLFPEKLPPLQLTSRPVKVKDIWGEYNYKKNAAVGSTIVHVVAIGAIIGLTILGRQVVKKVQEEHVTLVAPDLSEVMPIAPQKKVMGGGGGGGDRDKIQAPKGKLPKQSMEQITPPAMVIRNEHPKLEVQPTVVVPPNVKLNMAPNMPNMGNPLSTSMPTLASNGTGSGGGIGAGSGGGVGIGEGPGVGMGKGGGYGGGVFRVGGGVSAPRALNTPDPEYSEEARKAKYQGTVVLWLIVDQNGRPQQVKVARSLGMGLDQKAIEAVRKWTFEPAMKDGKPVAVQINVEVNFRLY